MNAQFPAPVVYANHEISHRVCDMVFGALAAVIPDRVMACSQGTSAVLTLGGVDYRTGEHYVSYETVKGGFGARPDRDGISAIASGISNTMNTPVEILEMSFPVRVENYELLPDSGGAGRWRGGLGARRTWRILERDSRATVCCERTKSPPFGIAGGAAGAPARISVVEPGGAERGPQQQGVLRRPGRIARRLRRAGLGRLRAGLEAGPGPASRRPRGRLRHPGRRPPRLRRDEPRGPVPGRQREGVEGPGLSPLPGRALPRPRTPTDGAEEGLLDRAGRAGHPGMTRLRHGAPVRAPRRRAHPRRPTW